MIKFSNITKVYDDKEKKTIALDNVSFSLPNKGFIGLSGENGCGKTTLLNLLSTIDSDFTGDITINNLNVKTDYDYIRKNIVSYVFQENFFVTNLNVNDNVNLICNGDVDNKKINDLEINEKLYSYTNNLSGGQKQKVSILRGLSKNFKILIVDEPTSSLDDKTTKKVFEILSDISSTKLVILVSHDTEMMNAYCNIIVKLNAGHLEYVKNNNTLLDVEYRDDSAIFYGDVNLHSIKEDKMNESLNKNGYFKIIKKSSKHSNSVNDFEDIVYDKEEYKFDSKQKSILKKSYFKASLPKMIIFTLILSLLLFVFEAFSDFQNYDRNTLYYKTLTKGYSSYVIFEQDVYYSEDGLFNTTDINYITNNLNTSLDFGTNLESEIRFEFPYGEFYSPKIFSLIRTDFKDHEFVYGQIPEDSSTIVITDYTASALVAYNSKYDSFEDICNKGIDINNQHFIVSGIIKTDYSYYYNIKNSNDSFTKEEDADYEIKTQHYYSSLYILNNKINNEYAVCIGHSYLLESNDILASIVFDENITDGTAKINSKLALELGYDGEDNFEIKTNLNYIIVSGIVEDDNEKYRIYTSCDLKEELLSEYADYYMIDISNKEVFDYLDTNDLEYLSYGFEKANDVYITIKLMQNMFSFIVVLLFLIELVVAIAYLKGINKDNNHLYAILMTSGVDKKDYILVELLGLLATIAIEFIFNTILYFGLYGVINSLLINSYKLSTSIFNSHLSTLLVSNLILALLEFLVYGASLLIRRKTNLYDIIHK